MFTWINYSFVSEKTSFDDRKLKSLAKEIEPRVWPEWITDTVAHLVTFICKKSGQCKTQTVEALQTADCRLQTGGKMQTEGIKTQTADQG